MTKRKIKTLKVKLDLQGLDGNAFSLMGAFQKAARRQGVAQIDIDRVLADCRSGDYDHLLQVLIANTTTEGLDNDD